MQVSQGQTRLDREATLRQEIAMGRLPTLAQVFAAVEPNFGTETGATLNDQQSQWAWHQAIAAMSQMLQGAVDVTTHLSPQLNCDGLTLTPMAEVCDVQGVVLCGPTPVFSDLALLAHYKTWVLTPEESSHPAFQLLPADRTTRSAIESIPIVSLSTQEGFGSEPFCLIQTPQFSWVGILSPSVDGPSQFQFSFDPKTVEQIGLALQLHAQCSSRHRQWTEIEHWRQRFPMVAPHYRLPMEFSRLLLQRAAQPTGTVTPVHGGFDRSLSLGSAPVKAAQTIPRPPSAEKTGASVHSAAKADPLPNPDPEKQGHDVELLKALAHEVKTPLATIQTLTRLLLKRTDLPGEAMKRLQAIHRECSGQIDRFGLIFRAMELTRDACQSLPNRLTPISLKELLEDNLARWQTHAARRDLTLQISMPKQLPAIAIRDPHLLDQVLTGLMEYLGYSLAAGSHIHLQVALAGPQLKLQLKTQPNEAQTDTTTESPMLQAIGQLLMFQPETGGLSLSLPTTKHLFQALGGKLTVRKHHQSEVLTIFLPLGTESDAY
ncbi:MAG: HAMP domain-containing sensor histidine kinase [Thermosynechococcaceae cyanobacterium]